MKDWRTLKVGEKVHIHTDEFDGITDFDGVITEVAEDHAIMLDEAGAHNWIDDWTEELFTRI